MGFSNNKEEEIRKNDELNILHFFNVFIRNKKLISFITLFSFTFSIFISITRKKIWEGQFEIVLNNESNPLSSKILNNSNLSRFSGLGSFTNNNSSLKTQLEILRSPSVLMPVFEYIKKEKIISDKSFKKMEFSAWRKKNLKVELKDGTSVLKLNLKDKDRNLIIPSLSIVAKTYEQYSGKSKQKELLITEEYLTDLLEKYQKKSSESFTKAQEFAIKENLYFDNYDFGILQMQDPSKQNNIQNNTQNNIQFRDSVTSELNRIKGSIIALEETRIRLNNKIINIDNQLKEIKEIQDLEQLQYLGSTIPGLYKLGLPQELDKIQKELAFLNSIYTEKDISIKRIIERRDIIAEVLKKNAIGYLKADRIATSSALEAATKPKDIIIKYRELLREAERDERTLIELENNITFITLEKGRLEKPWDLITKPTLYPNSVAPRKINYASIGILIGLLLSYFYALIKEKKSEIIFEPDILESLLGTKILDSILVSTKLLKKYSIEIFEKEILENLKSGKTKIIISSAIKKDKYDFIFDTIFKNKRKYELIESLNNLEDENILFIADLYSTKITEVYNLKMRLEIKNKNLFGILLLE